MPQLIRNSVFETNSSSTHSLTIVSGGEYVHPNTLVPDYDNILRVPAGDFGWSVEDYYDAESKLSYLLIYIRDWVNDEEVKARFMELLQQEVGGYVGAASVMLDDDNRMYGGGYIDHQSVEDRALDYIFEQNLIKDLVFNPNSFVHTDNDNY